VGRTITLAGTLIALFSTGTVAASCSSSSAATTTPAPDGGADLDSGDGDGAVLADAATDAAQACTPFVPTVDEPHGPQGGDALAPGRLSADKAHGTVTDTMTGVVYEATPADELTYDEAACHCRDLRTAGASDWRLPSRFELEGIVDYVKVIPAINGPAFDATLFPAAPIAAYWTSTLFASGNPAQVNLPYIMSLGDGRVDGASQTGQERSAAWCVRGGKAPPTPTRFTTTTDTVTDTWTKLVWQRGSPAESQALDHDGAAAYCAALMLEGMGGYRIPGVKELQTIVAAGRHAPAIDTGLFPGTPSLLFHTNAPYSAQPSDTWWFVDFTDGVAVPTTVFPSSGRKAEPVRCVRSLP
jgi:hypothetical protein